MGLTDWRHTKYDTPFVLAFCGILLIVLWCIGAFYLVRDIVISGFHIYHLLLILMLLFYIPFGLFFGIQLIQEAIQKHKDKKKANAANQLNDAMLSYLSSLDDESRHEFLKGYFSNNNKE